MKKRNSLKNVPFLIAVLFVVISCSSSNSPETYTLESTVTPANAGTVSPSGGSYDAGEQVQVTASPNGSWVFKEWNGDLSGNQNPASITIDKNMSINAMFEELTYPLTIEIEGQGEVSEQIVNAKTDYPEGSTVQLTATPAENWKFLGWELDLSGGDNPATITMDQEKTIRAVFVETYELTINIEGEGDVSEEIVNGKTEYTQGTMVELTGNPSSEWRFVEWTGDLETDENPAIVTMDGPKTTNARFEFGFNEDFEDGEAQNWLFSDDRFSVNDGKLEINTGADDNWAAAFYNQRFRNFKVEAKMVRLKSNGTEDNTLAIYIRAEGSLEDGFLESGYQFGITQSGYGSVFKIEDGESTEYSPWVWVKEINHGLGKYNVVTVNVVGSTFEIFVNGIYIITLSDDQFSEGFVGIGTYAGDGGDNQVLWEYVKVSPADPLRSKSKMNVDHPNAVQGNSRGLILK